MSRPLPVGGPIVRQPLHGLRRLQNAYVPPFPKLLDPAAAVEDQRRRSSLADLARGAERLNDVQEFVDPGDHAPICGSFSALVNGVFSAHPCLCGAGNIPRMTGNDTFAERLKLAIKASGKSMRKASLDAGMSADAVRGMRRHPKGMPSIETIRRVASSLDVSPDWLAFNQGPMVRATTVDPSGNRIDPADPDDSPAERTVPLVGYVGAGGGVQRIQGVEDQYLDQVPAPDGWTPQTVAVEIRGDSLGSLFDRWLVYYDEVRRPVTDDMIGKLCVVGLADDRVMVKKILRRNSDDLFDLVSEKDGPILGVAIEWAARVKTMAPR